MIRRLIQAALDRVAKRVPGAHGERGAVELAVGKFRLAGTLAMHVSGVVLRGAGTVGVHATVLEMVGAPHLAIEMKGEFQQHGWGPRRRSLTRMFRLAQPIFKWRMPLGFMPPTIQIVKPVTTQWTHFMGMDHMTRDGKPEVWVQNDIRVRRRVRLDHSDIIKLQSSLD